MNLLRSARSVARVTVPSLLVAAALATALAAPPVAPPVTMNTTAPGPSSPSAPPPLVPLVYHREVADIVARMLEEVQYEREPIDDATSERWLGEYLHRLDPGRMIFLQSDIDEFMAWRTQLDDQLAARPLPKLDAGMAIYERYRQRYAVWAATSATLAAGPLDLTDAERITLDRTEQGLPWPKTQAEAEVLWRQQVEDNMIDNLLADQDTEQEIRDRLVKRYQRFAKNLGDMGVEDVLEVYLGALCETFDPHSLWMPPADADNFNIDITNSVVGIGAQLSVKDEYVTVNDVIRGGPAFKSGKLRKEDRILSVAQGNEPPVDVVGARLDKVVSMIRGVKGTEVRLLVEHADNTREEILLVREQVRLEETAASSLLEDHGGHKVGVVKLPQFYVDPNGDRDSHGASGDVARELQKLKAEGAEGVILDLRDNGGGSLAEAVAVAGLFLPGGPVVQVRDRQGRIEALHDEDPTVVWSGPLVVMTDATSASASEIVAGALQDYGRGLVVGDPQTHGKGTVQQVIPLTPQLRGRYDSDVGGNFKVTIQKFYRVSGGSTQLNGVAADVVLPSRWEGIDVFEKNLDNAMDWDRIPPAPYARSGDFSRALTALREKSAARVAADPEFTKRVQVGEELERRKASPTLSLSLPEREAELAAWKALTGPDPDDSKLTDEEKKLADRAADYALDEGFAVLVDLLAVK